MIRTAEPIDPLHDAARALLSTTDGGSMRAAALADLLDLNLVDLDPLLTGCAGLGRLHGRNGTVVAYFLARRTA